MPRAIYAIRHYYFAAERCYMNYDIFQRHDVPPLPPLMPLPLPRCLRYATRYGAIKRCR